jgi:hypothetical protein
MCFFNPRHCMPILLFLAMSPSLGCLPRSQDISGEPRIRELGLLGTCLVVKTDVPLVAVGPPYRRLAFQYPSQPEAGGPGQRLGTVLAGTRLRVVRIERAAIYSDGMFLIMSDIAFARIETGEHAGKAVDLGWGWHSSVLPKADDLHGPYALCSDGG